MNKLIGQNLIIYPGDPWDFCEQFGDGPFKAKILRTQESTRSIILEFEEPFVKDGQEYKHFNASIRHHGNELSDLLNGKTIHCSFLYLTQEYLDSEDPFDESWWRGGGLSFIGSVKKQ